MALSLPTVTWQLPHTSTQPHQGPGHSVRRPPWLGREGHAPWKAKACCEQSGSHCTRSFISCSLEGIAAGPTWLRGGSGSAMCSPSPSLASPETPLPGLEGLEPPARALCFACSQPLQARGWFNPPLLYGFPRCALPPCHLPGPIAHDPGDPQTPISS